ncbi:MAG: YHS domain-containing protein [Anaerolineales bacterium]
MTQHDPVCGMDIEPQSAFAKREHMGQMFYFCSQSCVDQFDKDPHHYVMTSATTGFNPERTLTRIELPVADLPFYKPVTSLESGLRALEGVHQVTTNAGAGVLQVEYDSKKVNIPQIAEVVRSGL